MRALIAFTATLMLCSTALPDDVKEQFQERLQQVDASIELLDQCLHILQNGISQCVSTHPDESTSTVELTTATQPTEHTTSSTSEHTNTESPTEGPREETEPTERTNTESPTEGPREETEPAERTSSTTDHGDGDTEIPTEHAHTEDPTEDTNIEDHQAMTAEAERGRWREGKERSGGRREEEEEQPIYVIHIDRTAPSGQVVDVYPYVPKVSDYNNQMQGDELPTNLLGYPGEEPMSSSRDDPYFVIVDEEDGDDGEPNLYIARTVSSSRKHGSSHHGRGPLSGRGPHRKKIGGIDDDLLRLLFLKSKKESNEKSRIDNKWLVWFRNRPTENTSEPVVTEYPEVTEEPSQPATTEHPAIVVTERPEVTEEPSQPGATEHPETVTTERPEVTEEPRHPVSTEYHGPTRPTFDHHTTPPVITHHPPPSHPTTPTFERPTQKVPTERPELTRPTYDRHRTSPPTDTTLDTSTPNLNDTNTTGSTTASTTSPTTGSPITIDNTNPTTETTTSPTTDATTSPTTGSPATIDNTNPTTDTTSSPTTETTTSPTTGSPATIDNANPTTDSTSSPTTETTTSPTTGRPATIDTTNGSPASSDMRTTEPPTTGTPATEEEHHQTEYTDTTNSTESSSTTIAPTTDLSRDNTTDASTTQVPTDRTDDGGSGDDLFSNETTDVAERPSETDSRNDSTVEPRDDLAEEYLVVNIDRSTGTDVVSAYMLDNANSQSMQVIGRRKGKGGGKDPLIIDRSKQVTLIVVINEGDSPTSLPPETAKPEDDEETPLYPEDSDLGYSKDDKSDSSEMVSVRVHEAKKTAGGTYGYGKAVDDAINYALQNSKRRKRGSSQASHVRYSPKSLDSNYDDASANIPTEASQPPEHTAQECLELLSHYFRQYYLRKLGFVHADTERQTEH